MHTPLCRHATGEPTEYATRALEIGLKEIGFSDHSPMRQDDFDNWRMYASQLDEYVEKVRKAQQDHPSLTIKLALEVDYLPGQEEWIRELAARHPWDYFIGSVHYVSETWDFDNPEKLSEWKSRDPYEVWSVYFDWMTRAAETGLFQIMGHADLAKKFCFVPKTAIELNTAGLRKDCKEIYPSKTILALAHERKVPITFGADAHKPAEVGMDFDKAVQLARSVGYTHTLQFTQRQRKEVTF